MSGYTEFEIDMRKVSDAFTIDMNESNHAFTIDMNKGNNSFETDPTIPNHVRNITEDDINNWNNKSTFSGSYNDLTDKPIPQEETDPTMISITNKEIENILKKWEG